MLGFADINGDCYIYRVLYMTGLCDVNGYYYLYLVL